MTQSFRTLSFQAVALVAVTLLMAASIPRAQAQTCGGGNPCGGSGAASQSSGGPDSGAGNPIDVITGNKYQREPDYEATGDLPLEFVRHYNSVGVQGGAFGGGWSHSYETYLVRTESRASGSRIEIVQADGRRIQFTPLGAPVRNIQRYVSTPAGFGTIEESSDAVSALRETNPREHSALDALRPWVWQWADGRRLRFDGRGVLKRIEHAAADVLDLRHDALGRLVSVADASGRQITVTYWDDARELLDRFGPTTTASNGEKGRVRRLLLPDGRALEYAYDSNGLLSQVKHPDGSTRRYEYALVGNGLLLAKIWGRSGKLLGEYEYDGSGRAIASAQLPDGHKVRLAYEVDGESGHTVVTNANGAATTYRWRLPVGGQPQLLEAVGPGCASCPAANVRYEYDARGLVTAVEQLAEPIAREELEYDEVSRLVARYDVRGGERTLIERYRYSGADPYAKPTRIERRSVVSDQLHTFDLIYNERGQPVRLTERGFAPQPAAGSFDALSRVTTYEYFEAGAATPRLVGKLKSIDGPLPGTVDAVEYEYGARGELLALRYSSGTRESFEYDALGRLVAHTPLDGVRIELGHDSEGRVASFTRAGLATAVEYDSLGRLSKLRDPIGQHFTFGYDAASRLTSVTDASRNRIMFELAGEGRPVAKRLLNPDGSVSQEIAATPEEVARLTPSQSTWSPSVLAAVRLPTLSPWATRADALIAPATAGASARRAITDERGLPSDYVYDDFGRLAYAVNPDSGVIRFEYDAAGRLVARHFADGRAARYEYDEHNRPIRIDTEGEITTIEYGPRGKPARIRYGVGEESFEYDDAARLTARVQLIDGKRFTTAYAYDALGRLSETRLPDGETLVYRYNASIHAKPGVLAAIERRGIFGATTLVAGLNDADDRFHAQRSRFGNGLEFTRELDRRGRLVRFGTAGVAEFDFETDDAGRITLARGETHHGFQYDEDGRLIGAASVSGNAVSRLGFALDPANNVSVLQSAAADYRFRIDSNSNRVLARLQRDGTEVRYEYDAAGRTTRIGTRRFEYDGHGRLARISEAGRPIAEYAYNAFGERIRKVAYSGDQRTVTYFFYDGAKLTAEADQSGTITRHFVYVGDRIAAAIVDGRVYAVHTDWRGAPVALTDEDKRVAWRADADALGRVEVRHARFDVHLRGSNQYYDAESGLHYNLARYFDPTSSRYLTPDPIGQQGGLNLYAFVAGDPVNAIDPLGTQATPLPGNTSVVGWSFQDRLAYVLRTAAPLVPGEIGNQLREMASPANIAIAAGVFAVWAASQLTPAGWIADIAIGVIGYIFMGEAIVRMMELIIDTYRMTSNARCVNDLNQAARNFARITSEVAVALGGAGATRLTRLMSRLFRNTRSGVWNLDRFERGRRIEQALGANTPTNNYPVIDRWNPATRIGTSIKSVDLNAATYQQPSGLRSLIRGYIRDIAGFNGANHGGLDTRNIIAGRELEIVIPQAPTAAQQQVFNQMIQEAQRAGVTLRIIVFP